MNPLPGRSATGCSSLENQAALHGSHAATASWLAISVSAVAEANEANNTAQLTFGMPETPANVVACADLRHGLIHLAGNVDDTNGISRYWVYRSAGANGPEELIGSTVGTTIADSFFQPGVEYSYSIRALIIAGFSLPEARCAERVNLAKFQRADASSAADGCPALYATDGIVGNASRWKSNPSAAPSWPPTIAAPASDAIAIRRHPVGAALSEVASPPGCGLSCEWVESLL